jgi:DNA-binding HxlR family transcriptional regulator
MWRRATRPPPPWQYSFICAFSFNLHYASEIATLPSVLRAQKSKRRSGCPVSISLEIFGDRWSLLVIRDLMVRGYRTFKEFQDAGEGIATNILADRLQKLEAAGIITVEDDAADGRKMNYRLTEKGIDLAPVLLELLVWGARHGDVGVSCAPSEITGLNRDQILAEVRRRWRERDSTPLIPGFDAAVVSNLARSQRDH